MCESLLVILKNTNELYHTARVHNSLIVIWNFDVSDKSNSDRNGLL